MRRTRIETEPPFSLHREDAANASVIVVEGAIDIVTAPKFRKALESIPEDRNVVVDL